MTTANNSNAASAQRRDLVAANRRFVESTGLVQLCATPRCDNDAAHGSCYCERCEANWDEDE